MLSVASFVSCIVDCYSHKRLYVLSIKSTALLTHCEKDDIPDVEWIQPTQPIAITYRIKT